MNNYSNAAHAKLEAAIRELNAAQIELESLREHASPSRLERALERFAAAKSALTLVA